MAVPSDDGGDDVGSEVVAGHDAPPAAAAVDDFDLLFMVVTTLVVNAETGRRCFDVNSALAAAALTAGETFVVLMAWRTVFWLRPDILAAASTAGDGLRPGLDIGRSASDIGIPNVSRSATHCARCSLRC